MENKDLDGLSIDPKETDEAEAVEISSKDASIIIASSQSSDRKVGPYQLTGPQAEFAAAHWLYEPKIGLPETDKVKEKVSNSVEGKLEFSADVKVLDDDIDLLNLLVKNRNTEFSKISSSVPKEFVTLSDFINLQDPQFGTIFNASKSRSQYRVSNVVQQQRRIRLKKQLVLNGRELARMFEGETPGLLHRQALNWLLFNRPDISPPRQARIWAALDLTIYAALAAAWHYKWAEGPKISFRQRPVEYEPKLNVLYDSVVGDLGVGNGVERKCPAPHAGTPRHPAYPSGHSTYSAAASHILKYFFRDPYSVEQLDLLADNIGLARLWGGVHWMSDHTFGQKVGIAVADLIIDQLKNDCVPPIVKDKNNPLEPIVPMEPGKECKEASAVKPPSSKDVDDSRGRREGKGCPDAQVQDVVPPLSDQDARTPSLL